MKYIINKPETASALVPEPASQFSPSSQNSTELQKTKTEGSNNSNENTSGGNGNFSGRSSDNGSGGEIGKSPSIPDNETDT
ncbi:hypothetical protein YYC_05058 [Plasmodium yoelii 17X]|uniref:Uncharacterized protein n=1 Tax=Plasmodium yoelii 17X TaxID=1323249 RepID=V7PEU3_PLAYE|nr:hypothetical protein YYC_05058 [Plasmodium yoelii 17X]